MAVPAHDQRDFEFAKKYGLPLKEVIKNPAESRFPKEAFAGEGELVDSGDFTGLQSKEAIDKISEFLTKKGLGRRSVSYKLRDWVFSRQHYWGEPIPLIFCENCAKKPEGLNPGWIAVPEDQLPVELPYVENYQPTQTGESPLAAIRDWVKVSYPICGGQARRETDTMPNWAGSSWYYLRYPDPRNNKQFADPRKLKYWLPVDWYNGGVEHTTLHLLYSRFWHKFLFDLGLVTTTEPYTKRTSHGVVLGPDGQKMSKSRGNVVNPDEVVSEFGADAFRMYEAFMGPFEQMIPWDPRGILGVRRFLDKVWRAHQLVRLSSPSKSGRAGHRPVPGPAGNRDRGLVRALHRLIKKVEEDLLSLKFNTAMAAMMEFINQLASGKWQVASSEWKTFLKVLAPYAPHLAEELWHSLGEVDSIHLQSWPKYDPRLISSETATVVVQVDGKFRGKMEVAAGTKEAEVVGPAKELETVKPHLLGKKLVKTIFRPDNLINFVTR